MKAGRTRTRIVALAALAAIFSATTACASDNTPSPGATPTSAATAIKTGLKITFMPKQTNNNYFTTSDNGGKAAIGEFGGVYAESAPPKTDAAAQAALITAEAQKKTDVLVVSANDKDALCGAIKDAQTAGSKVVTFDSDTSCRDLFINQATSDGIAKVQIDMIKKAVPGGGEIAILSASATATNQNSWIATMKTELAKPENANWKLVDTVYGDDNGPKSFAAAQGLIANHPNLKGIISPTTVGIAAAARYLSGSSYKGKVQLTGLGTPNDMRAYVTDGTVGEFALWNPADLGYLAAYGGAALASGMITGAEGDKFKAGKLGEFTVGADHTVLLGDPFVFTKDNIAQFNF